MIRLLKKIIPREKADRFGVGATLFLISLVCINGIHKLSKTINDHPNYSVIIFFSAFYTLFNVLGNMYKAITTDTTIYSIENPPINLLEEWRYCSGNIQSTFNCKSNWLTKPMGTVKEKGRIPYYLGPSKNSKALYLFEDRFKRRSLIVEKL